MTVFADIYVVPEKDLLPGQRPHEGYARRFFLLTLASGKEVEVSADHYRLSESGLLALANWMGPHEPDFAFQVHTVYAPGSWALFTEDEASHEQWVEEMERRVRKIKEEADASRVLREQTGMAPH